MKHLLTKIIPLVMLLFVSASAFAQTKTVRGTVKDANDNPVPDVIISAEGSDATTVTDDAGNFSLSVPDGTAALIVKAFGTPQQRHVISGSGDQSIMINSTNVKQIGESVVTALGIKRDERALGYSIQNVSEDDIVNSGQNNTVNALRGKIAGANIVSSAGTPGASSKINIRGNEGQPLFVIDGVPVDNSTDQITPGDYPFNQNLQGVNASNRAVDINPDDIESVTVLKGPAASAMYGVRGGNGVIMITTKKGAKNKAMGITYTTGVMFSKVNKLPEFQTRYLQGNVFNSSTADDWTDGNIYLTPLQWGANNDSIGQKIYNRYDDFFQTGKTWRNNVNISGGTDKLAYKLNLGYLNDNGMVPNSQFKRTNVGLNLSYDVSDRLTVGADANYIRSGGTRVQNGSNLGGIMLGLVRAPFDFNVSDYLDKNTGAQKQYYAIYDNPLYSAYYNPYTDNTNRIIGSLNAKFDLNDHWFISSRLGTDQYSTVSEQRYGWNSWQTDNQDGTGQLNLNTYNYQNTYLDVLLNYQNVVSNNFVVGGLIGYNYWDTKSSGAFSRGREQLVEGLYNLNNFADRYASNSKYFGQTQSIMSQVNIGYKDMLFMNLTGRADWLSAFGNATDKMKGVNVLFYPSINLGFVFSELMNNTSGFFNYGKFRVSFADAGTGPQSYFSNQVVYYTQPNITDGYTNGNSFPYLGNGGYAPSSTLFPGNVKPQHIQSTEFGVDLRFWQNRLKFDVTRFNQRTLDNIMSRPIAPSTGYQAIYTNAGEYSNKGWEIMASADFVKNSKFNWNFSTNWTKYKSEVLSLAEGVSEISAEAAFTSIGSYNIVGEPLGVFYGTRWDRDAAGNILIDEDGLPIVADKTGNIGNPNPDWLLALTNDFTWNKFNFGFMFDIRQGGDVYNGTYGRMNNYGISKATEDREGDIVVDGVYAPGTPNAGQPNSTPIPKYYYWRLVKGDAGAAAEAFVQDGSWVRLRSLYAGYTFDLNTSGKSWIQSMRVDFMASNLWLKTEYTGVDPETSLTGAGSKINGLDYFNNPGAKTYSINLKFNF